MKWMPLDLLDLFGLICLPSSGLWAPKHGGKERFWSRPSESWKLLRWKSLLMASMIAVSVSLPETPLPTEVEHHKPCAIFPEYLLGFIFCSTSLRIMQLLNTFGSGLMESTLSPFVMLYSFNFRLRPALQTVAAAIRAVDTVSWCCVFSDVLDYLGPGQRHEGLGCCGTENGRILWRCADCCRDLGGRWKHMGVVGIDMNERMGWSSSEHHLRNARNFRCQ